jgi:hypothetical protein
MFTVYKTLEAVTAQIQEIQLKEEKFTCDKQQVLTGL